MTFQGDATPDNVRDPRGEGGLEELGENDKRLKNR